MAGHAFANADDAFGGRLVVEHGVELNDAMNVGQGDAQGLADGFLHFAGQPAVQRLGFMEEREEGVAGTAVILF